MRQKNPKFKAGMKVKIIANGAGHSQPIGSVVTIVRANVNTYGDCTIKNDKGQVYTAHAGDITLAIISKKDIEESIKELEAEIKQEKLKLKYLQATKQEEFDEEEFQAFQVLTAVKDKKASTLEQAKQIVKILRN